MFLLRCSWKASWDQHEAPLEPCETGTAKYLALEEFQTRNMPLHRTRAPGQGALTACGPRPTFTEVGKSPIA
jgi:hypothetical protein